MLALVRGLSGRDDAADSIVFTVTRAYPCLGKEVTNSLLGVWRRGTFTQRIVPANGAIVTEMSPKGRVNARALRRSCGIRAVSQALGISNAYELSPDRKTSGRPEGPGFQL